MNKIYHMASFSRSGETLMLRCLNAHPDIEVVHQIDEPDSAEDRELFKKFMSRKQKSISADDPIVLHRNLKPGSILLLKNAVWIHTYPRHGFTLVRNPFSVVASAKRENPPPPRITRQRLQQIRWANHIDRGLVPMMQSGTTLLGFLALYSRKMLQDRRDGLRFVRYEDFVLNPEVWLRKIVAHMGLPWDDQVLRSHEFYPKGLKGHGGINLGQPISAGSIEKYKSLSEITLSRIYGLTHEVLELYGYRWNGNEVVCTNADGML